MMKTFIMLIVGMVLILFSVNSLFTAINDSRFKFNVDFGCAGIEMNSPKNIKPTTRIEYCIGYISYNTISGSSVYASGETDKDNITVGELEFKRVDQTLFINNQKVESGETYETFEWSQSKNPWLIETTRFAIRNAGISSKSSVSPGKIYIDGTVHGGWSFSPLGLIILILGIGLFKYGYGNGGSKQRVNRIVKPG